MKEAEQLKNVNQEYEHRFKTLSDEFVHTRQRHYEQEIESWKFKFEQVDNDRRFYLKELEEYDTQRQLQQQDNHKLQQLLEVKDKEIEQFRHVVFQLEQEIAKKNDLTRDHENTILLLTKEMESNNSILLQTSDQLEKSRMENELITYTVKKNQYLQSDQQKRRLEELQHEVHRLNQELKRQQGTQLQLNEVQQLNRLMESESLKIKNEYEYQLNQVQQSLWKTQNRVIELEDDRNSNNKLQNQILELENSLAEQNKRHKSYIEKQQREFEKEKSHLTQLMEQLQQENALLSQQIQFLHQNINNLNRKDDNKVLQLESQLQKLYRYMENQRESSKDNQLIHKELIRLQDVIEDFMREFQAQYKRDTILQLANKDIFDDSQHPFFSPKISL